MYELSHMYIATCMGTEVCIYWISVICVHIQISKLGYEMNIYTVARAPFISKNYFSIFMVDHIETFLCRVK